MKQIDRKDPETDSNILRLMDTMSDISEDAMCASWLIDNEYILWAIMKNRIPNRYGLGPVDEKLLTLLAVLSDKTDSWVIWIGDEELETFGIEVPDSVEPWFYTGEYVVSRAEFEVMFEKWAEARAAEGHPLRLLSQEEEAQLEAEIAASWYGGKHIFDFEGRKEAVEKLRQEKGWKPLEPFYGG